MIIDRDQQAPKQYVHQDYPCWLNYHESAKPKLVANADEEAAAVELGWSRAPKDAAAAEAKDDNAQDNAKAVKAAAKRAAKDK